MIVLLPKIQYRICLIFPILLGFAAQSSAFPLWLDNPSRNNPNDPKSSAWVSPNLAATATPNPTKGLTITIQDANGVGRAGFIVMPHNQPSLAVTTGSNGVASFPTLNLPNNILVVAPLALSSSVQAVTDLLNVDVNSLTLNQLYLYAPTQDSATVEVTQGVASGFNLGELAGGSFSITGGIDVFSIPSCTSNAIAAGDQISTFCYGPPGTQINPSALQYDCSGNVTAALFFPPATLGATPLLLSGTTQTSGFSVASTAYTVSGNPIWTFAELEASVGTSSTNLWAVQFMDNLSPPASGNFGWAWPPASDYFVATYIAEASTATTTDENNVVQTFSSAPASINFNLMAPCQVLQYPSHLSGSVSVAYDPSLNTGITGFFLHGASSGMNWTVFDNCVGCSVPWTYSMPSLPPGSPPQYSFQIGESIDVNGYFNAGPPDEIWQILNGAPGSQFIGNVSDLSYSRENASLW